MLDHALAYIKAGHPVFPCRSKDDSGKEAKTPLTPNGFLNATTDEDQVRTWWEQWPDAAIGMPAAGFVIIDIDPVDGQPNPWLTADRMMDFSRCPTVRTPRGWHYYFRRPQGCAWGCSAGQISPGVDVRTDGGYVILPPSIEGGYQLVEGPDLDGMVPEVPGWLEDMLENPDRKPLACVAVDGRIPMGHRNQSLASMAGHLRQVGCSEGEIAALLLRANVERCNPPLSVSEVEKIAWSIARKEPDQSRTAVAWDHYGQDRAKGPLLRVMTSAEFDDEVFTLEYLVDGFLVASQPGVLGASKKTLKTMILEDIGINLAAGRPVLKTFPVKQPVSVMLLSGESGGSTLQRNARTIAEASGLRLRDLPVFWSLDLPQLHHADHMAELESAIKANGIRLCAIDPLYLCLLAHGSTQQASNVYAMGNAFRAVGDIGQRNNCTILLVHHFKQSHREDQYTVPTLDDLSYAGISEFVRQWVLLRREKKYLAGSGMHDLFLSVGGSAGHSGAWRVHVDEGTANPVAGGRKWEVTVRDLEDAEEEAKKGRKGDPQKARAKVLVGLLNSKHWPSRSGLMKAIKMRPSTYDTAFDSLVSEGMVEEVRDVTQYPVYRLSLLGDQEAKTFVEMDRLNEANQYDDSDQFDE